ncbi:nuclear localization sequence binding protein [Savitreella phatthalungensis]
MSQQPQHPQQQDAQTTIFVGRLAWSLDEARLANEFARFGAIQSTKIIRDRMTGRSKGFGYVEFANHDEARAALSMHGTEIEGFAINVDLSQPRAPAGGAPPTLYAAGSSSSSASQSQQFRGQHSSRPPLSQDKSGSSGNIGHIHQAPPNLIHQNSSTSTGSNFSQPVLRPPSEPSNTVFVGNLSFAASERDLFASFSGCGTIRAVRLPRYHDTGKMKGYAYVEFEDVESAARCVEMGRPKEPTEQNPPMIGAGGGIVGGVTVCGRPVRLDFSQPRQPRAPHGQLSNESSHLSSQSSTSHQVPNPDKFIPDGHMMPEQRVIDQQDQGPISGVQHYA